MEVEEEEEPKEEKSSKEVKTVEQLSPEEKAQQSTIEKMTKILSGEKSIFFHLQVDSLAPYVLLQLSEKLLSRRTRLRVMNYSTPSSLFNFNGLFSILVFDPERQVRLADLEADEGRRPRVHLPHGHCHRQRVHALRHHPRLIPARQPRVAEPCHQLVSQLAMVKW